MHLPRLSHVLVEGYQGYCGEQAARLHLEQVGNVALPTGTIVAADPLVECDRLPFTTTVTPGEYPVTLSLAQIGSERRVAYATIQLTHNQAVKWEMALIEGQTISELGADEFFGYGVDSGTGCFMDYATAQFIARSLDEETFAAELIEKMSQAPWRSGSQVNLRLPDLADGNLIAFSSGWGDGAYPSYFGFDEAGQVTQLVTDFGLLNEESTVSSSAKISRPRQD